MVCGTFPTARAERWGILVTLDPSATKASHTVNFTLTLQNTGDLEVTTCRIDIQYAWESSPQTVTTESRTIAVGKNESWIAQEAIPPLTPGSYLATVTVTARTLLDQSCTSSDWCNVHVDILPNIPPTAEFTHEPSTPAPNTVVNFVDASMDSDGVVTGWYWEFGDASNSFDRNPSHAFSFAGMYTVVLTVTDNDGATNSVTQTVLIGASPFRDHPKSTGFGVLEWGLTGAVAAGLSLVAAILIKRRMRPSRRWGQTQQPQEPPDTGRRWRPR